MKISVDIVEIMSSIDCFERFKMNDGMLERIVSGSLQDLPPLSSKVSIF